MSEKLSQITTEATSVDATDRFYIVQGGVSKYIDGTTMESLYGGGSSALEYQTVITATSTTLDGTQKGLNKVYPFQNTSAQTVQIDNGDYIENDVINIERRGSGTLEVVQGTNVRIRGVRDGDNRYFINDNNSLISLLCRGNDGTNDVFTIIGRLKDGYTGAVTTSSYSSLSDVASAQDVTVIGTGFSDNMLVSLTGNATLNSFTVVSSTETTLNITPSGTAGDQLTVTYDNGDIFVDTNAITLGSSFDADLIAYWSFDNNSNDLVGSHNGTDTNITYVTDGNQKVGSYAAEFNNTSSQINITDHNELSFGDGASDVPFSMSTFVWFDTLGVDGIFCKGIAASQYEYQIRYNSTYLEIKFFNNLATSAYLQANYTWTPTTSTWYHIAVTYDGSSTYGGITLYINGSAVSTSDASSGSYVAMDNGIGDLIIGNQTNGGGNRLDGKLDGMAVWNKELSAAEVLNVYNTQNAGTELV